MSLVVKLNNLRSTFIRSLQTSLREIALLSIMQCNTQAQLSHNMHLSVAMFYRKVQTLIKTLSIINNSRIILPRSVSFLRRFPRRAHCPMRMNFLRVSLFNQVHNSPRIYSLHKLMYLVEHFSKQSTVGSKNNSMDLKVVLSIELVGSRQTSNRKPHWHLLRFKISL